MGSSALLRSAPICPECGIAFLTSIEMREHLRMAHSPVAGPSTAEGGTPDAGSPWNRCPVCAAVVEGSDTSILHPADDQRRGLGTGP